MQWYENDVSKLEERIASGEIAQGSNLFYGSSSLTLWDGLSEAMMPYDTASVAFGGSTLEACNYFFERLVVPAKPRSLIVYAGDNDIGDGRYHSDVMAEFEKLLMKRVEHLPGIRFTFIAVKPSPSRHHYLHRIRLFNRYVKERLEGINNTFYLDVHSPMLTADGMPDGTLYLEDGLHLNAKGYELWQKLLLDNAQGIFQP